MLGFSFSSWLLPASVSQLGATPAGVCRRHNYGLGITAEGEKGWLALGTKMEEGNRQSSGLTWPPATTTGYVQGSHSFVHQVLAEHLLRVKPCWFLQEEIPCPPGLPARPSSLPGPPSRLLHSAAMGVGRGRQALL